MKLLSGIRRSQLLRTTLLQGVDFSARAISMMVITIAIARAGGPSMLGVFSFALTTAATGRVIAELGLGLYVTREAARDPAAASPRLSEAFTLALIAAPALVMAAFFLGTRMPEIGSALPLAATGLCLFSLTAIFRGAFLGIERLEYHSISIILQEVIFAGVGTYVITYHQSLPGLMAAYVASRAVGLIASHQFARRLGFSINLAFQPARLLRTARAALPYAADALFTVFYARSAILLLPLLQSTSDAGIFEAAFNLSLRLSVINQVVASAFLPRLSRASAGDKTSFAVQASRALRVAIGLSVSAAAITVAASTYLVSGLYGPQFHGSIPLLRVLALAIVPQFVGHTYATLLTASGRQKGRATVAGSTAMLALPLQAVCISWLGATGAAWATLAIESILCLGYRFVARNARLLAWR